MVEVRAYDPEWPRRFEEYKGRYGAALRAADVPFVAIEHVGSTSVPGLAAKPTIDIDIVVEATEVDAASAALRGLGFRPLGELGIPLRWAFLNPSDFPDTNTYVIVAGSLSVRNDLAIRDTLRSNPALRDEYGTMKLELSRTVADIEEFGAGKNSMIQRILAAACLSEEDRASIGSNVVPPRRDRPLVGDEGAP